MSWQFLAKPPGPLPVSNQPLKQESDSKVCNVPDHCVSRDQIPTSLEPAMLMMPKKRKGGRPKNGKLGKGNRNNMIFYGSAVQEVFSSNSPLGFTISSPDDQIFTFTQSVTFGPYVTSTSAESDFGINFTLASLPGSSGLVAVFDQYRIDLVQLLLIPRYDFSTTTSTNSGLLYSAIDYDSTAAATVSALQQYANVQISTGLDSRRATFKPAANINVQAGTGTGQTPMTSPWIDSANATVQHRGFLFSVTQTDAVYTYDAPCKLRISFRSLI